MKPIFVAQAPFTADGRSYIDGDISHDRRFRKLIGEGLVREVVAPTDEERFCRELQAQMDLIGESRLSIIDNPALKMIADEILKVIETRDFAQLIVIGKQIKIQIIESKKNSTGERK